MKKEPLSIESPFSRAITKQLEADAVLVKTPTSDHNPLNGEVSPRLSMRYQNTTTEESNPLTLRMSKGNGTASGTTRRHNPTKSGLSDLLKRAENSPITGASDNNRPVYVIFGKYVKECCISCIFIEGDDNWTQRAQDFADQINAKFEELYENTIVTELKEDFETLKREEDMDPVLLEKVKKTFEDFSKDMEVIKTHVLTGDQHISSPSKRPHVAQIFND
jgi:hypothetical protein